MQIIDSTTFIYRVEGAIEFGLDSPVEESDEKMMRAPDHYETTLQSDSGWIDVNFTELPPLTLKHIHQYFISGRLHKERVTASKPFERGYRLMFAADDMNRTHASQGSSRGPSSTSLPRKWGVPAKPRKDPTPVNMLEVVKPKYGKVPQIPQYSQ